MRHIHLLLLPLLFCISCGSSENKVEQIDKYKSSIFDDYRNLNYNHLYDSYHARKEAGLLTPNDEKFAAIIESIHKKLNTAIESNAEKISLQKEYSELLKYTPAANRIFENYFGENPDYQKLDITSALALETRLVNLFIFSFSDCVNNLPSDIKLDITKEGNGIITVLPYMTAAYQNFKFHGDSNVKYQNEGYRFKFETENISGYFTVWNNRGLKDTIPINIVNGVLK